MLAQNKRLFGIMLFAFILLIVPAVAMQFTSEVNWGPMDFAIAAALLFGTGLLCEFVMRRVTTLKHRIAICAGILVVLLLVWAELAVGIFGTPLAGS